jgi:hypothetical protein
MSKPVVMRPEQWGTVLEHIKQREKPSVYLSREKMKETLGFTVRDHREYVKDPDYVKSPSPGEWHDLELGWFEGKTNVHTVEHEAIKSLPANTRLPLIYGKRSRTNSTASMR